MFIRIATVMNRPESVLFLFFSRPISKNNIGTKEKSISKAMNKPSEKSLGLPTLGNMKNKVERKT